ncbi:coiled-coil domain-containing protein 154 isoform X8 [Mastomys coucha]|uniref:coiled-coil domain-containing protein 154 isoform X8 n=1 Tax=Mastomys coucha TaxID=35658 RepID=UPI0012624878|nr:coiled-coil domain-containing protein 154 isoform X8 [Mastomys coucha]
MSEPADGLSLGHSPSQLSTATLEDLELLLTEGLASPEPSSAKISERYECSGLASGSLVPEQDTPKQWKQLEQWVAELQAEMVHLRGHKERCEHATLGLLRELLQVRARVQMQASELRQLRQEVQQAAWSPEKEEPEFSRPQSQNQMQTLDKRLVEVREALTHIRRKQALQDSERKHSEQEINLRLTNLAGMLSQEEQGREAACSTLQKNQEDTSQKVELGLAKMQAPHRTGWAGRTGYSSCSNAQMTKLNEEMSLRFLKREAKLCSFLQKSFLSLEQRMKSSESTRLMAESSLREELENRWQKLHELTEERLRVLRAQREAQAAWKGVERESLQDLVQWLKEVSAHVEEVQEKVNSLSRQIESVSNKCVLHKSDVDVKISAEGKAREFEVETVRQELASLLMSVQLLKEENPGRKIAEIQGQLATFQKQMIKLENSLQANKTIQNLKFNNETKLRTEEIATLRESMLSLWSEAGPWPLTLGSKRVFMSLVRQRFFIKDIALGEMVSVNSWGVYQAVRWLHWKTVLLNLVTQKSPGVISAMTQWKPASEATSLTMFQK